MNAAHSGLTMNAHDDGQGLSQRAEIRELAIDELDEVSGGFFLTLGLITIGLIAIAVKKC